MTATLDPPTTQSQPAYLLESLPEPIEVTKHVNLPAAKMDQVMIDIETMGTAPGSAIVAIGAVMFGKESDALGPEFYVTIDLKDAVDRGMTMDAETVLWWLSKEETARMELVSPARMNLRAALEDLGLWLCMNMNSQDLSSDHLQVWGNGASFDLVLLEAAYKLNHLPCPWRYWQQNCYRTISKLHPLLKLERNGSVHHHALDDARVQAKHLCRIWQATRQTAVPHAA